MAGIAGIIIRHPEPAKKNLNQPFAAMMQKMAVSKSQLGQTFFSKKLCFGNVVPVPCTDNQHYQYSSEVCGNTACKDLSIYAVIDGLVFVDCNERTIINKHYNIDDNQSDFSLIPFLYHLYGGEFVTHVTGWFNIFIYDENKNLSLLINDRLGFLPLYYYESDYYFIFASKIEAILATGMLPSIKPDAVTIAEHLFFNYPISDATYIEGIRTLSNAEFIKFQHGQTTKSKYWSIGQIYNYAPAGKKESVYLINEGLKYALNKALTRYEGKKLNLTLTGGWDSRVVLSYFLPQYKGMLNAYSFGAENTHDILVPNQIAAAEGIDYTPYVLDQNYLNNDFLPYALQTIELSGGTRNYKRTHYLYAVQKVSDISDFLVTGIYGDEVFKIAGPSAGEVICQNMIDLIKSDFDIDHSIKYFSESRVAKCLHVERKQLIEAFRTRLEHLKSSMRMFESITQKYYAFRFELNLRKYFGYEANSYNDFVYCFSPFIDYDFLVSFSHAGYFGIHYPFGSNSLFLKKQANMLYHDIVQSNYPPLIKYNSARGYSMKDSTGLFGNLKIIYKRYLRRKKIADEYNVKKTDDLFRSYVNTKSMRYNIIKPLTVNIASGINPTNLLSLTLWIESIGKKYGK